MSDPVYSFTVFAQRETMYVTKNGGPDATMWFLLLVMPLETRNVQLVHIPAFVAYTSWLGFSTLTPSVST